MHIQKNTLGTRLNSIPLSYPEETLPNLLSCCQAGHEFQFSRFCNLPFMLRWVFSDVAGFEPFLLFFSLTLTHTPVSCSNKTHWLNLLKLGFGAILHFGLFLFSYPVSNICAHLLRNNVTQHSESHLEKPLSLPYQIVICVLPVKVSVDRGVWGLEKCDYCVLKERTSNITQTGPVILETFFALL